VQGLLESKETREMPLEDQTNLVGGVRKAVEVALKIKEQKEAERDAKYMAEAKEKMTAIENQRKLDDQKVAHH
jgi:hypothetical protein